MRYLLHYRQTALKYIDWFARSKAEGCGRLASMVWAAFHQGDVNHITGDVNFLGLLMRKPRTMLTILDSASMARLTGWRHRLYGLVWLRLPVWRAGSVTVISENTRETLSFVQSGPLKVCRHPELSDHGHPDLAKGLIRWPSRVFLSWAQSPTKTSTAS